jgi:hypothetical protein
MMTYKKCPANYQWQYILGNVRKDPPSPAAQRGLTIHQSIEDFHNHEGCLHEDIPIVIAEHINLYYNVPEWTAYPEYEFAVTNEWIPTQFDNDNAYIRGYMDNLFVRHCPDTKDVTEVVVDEYKTGQEYDEHAQQKQLYAMICFVLFPEVNSVVVNGVYIDKKKIVPTAYSRAHLHSMQYTWDREIAKLSVPIYPARPGMHCRWCPKSKEKGGPCQLG